jgi:hypothetical protein
MFSRITSARMSVAILCLVIPAGVLLLSREPQSRAQAPGVAAKWEYAILIYRPNPHIGYSNWSLSTRNGTLSMNDASELVQKLGGKAVPNSGGVDVLNELGTTGWELVSESGQARTFKRRK